MGMGMGMFEMASQARSKVIASGQVRSTDLVVQTTAVQPTPSPVLICSSPTKKIKCAAQRSAVQCSAVHSSSWGWGHGGGRQGAICAGGWAINDRPFIE